MTLRALVLGTLALGTLACAGGPAPRFANAPTMALPEPEDVTGVLFLVGDAGAAHFEASPVLNRLRGQVEFWSERLAADAAVTVAFLGDNVYPVGVRDREHRDFAEDSTRLWSQVRVLDGPAARSRGARGLFLAGNHDWGNTTGEDGVHRLRNQQNLLDAARASGIQVRLLPEAGEPGPAVVDLPGDARVLAMDTHWYLQSRDSEAREAFFGEVDRALAGTGDRHLLVLAHHPYRSAGPHGFLRGGDGALGLIALLQNSGTLVQDLNSNIYAEFRERFDESIRAAGRPPLVFAAGHDHSLQVLDPQGPWEPRSILVSGAGSKLTPLTDVPDLRFASSRPGYMALFFRRDGAVDLFVLADRSNRPPCSGKGGPGCAPTDGAAVDLVHSERLVPPASGGP